MKSLIAILYFIACCTFGPALQWAKINLSPTDWLSLIILLVGIVVLNFDKQKQWNR